MEQVIDRLKDEMPSTLDSVDTPLTKSSIEIATIALRSLTGLALSKALAIAAAIIEYEDALKLTAGDTD